MSIRNNHNFSDLLGTKTLSRLYSVLTSWRFGAQSWLSYKSGDVALKLPGLYLHNRSVRQENKSNLFFIWRTLILYFFNFILIFVYFGEYSYTITRIRWVNWYGILLFFMSDGKGKLTGDTPAGNTCNFEPWVQKILLLSSEVVLLSSDFSRSIIRYVGVL